MKKRFEWSEQLTNGFVTLLRAILSIKTHHYLKYLMESGIRVWSSEIARLPRRPRKSRPQATVPRGGAELLHNNRSLNLESLRRYLATRKK